MDPCPNLPIPPTCNGRSVIFRDWGPSAVGDGTYFASQAPFRLGFNRMQGFIWVVKFRTDANTYMGRVSAYGDGTPGTAWISDHPCDPTFAVTSRLTAWGNTGGGTMHFTVARNDTDAQRLKSDPAYQAYWQTPLLRGGHCYYLAFENTESPLAAPTVAWLQSTQDTCQDINGNPGCYYLAFDMFHYLRDPISNGLMNGNVISGLTQP